MPTNTQKNDSTLDVSVIEDDDYAIVEPSTPIREAIDKQNVEKLKKLEEENRELQEKLEAKDKQVEELTRRLEQAKQQYSATSMPTYSTPANPRSVATLVAGSNPILKEVPAADPHRDATLQDTHARDQSAKGQVAIVANPNLKFGFFENRKEGTTDINQQQNVGANNSGIIQNNRYYRCCSVM